MQTLDVSGLESTLTRAVDIVERGVRFDVPVPVVVCACFSRSALAAVRSESDRGLDRRCQN